MWFVSKKKYDEMERLCEMWKASAEGADKRAEAWQKVAISCQEDNKRLVRGASHATRGDPVYHHFCAP